MEISFDHFAHSLNNSLAVVKINNELVLACSDNVKVLRCAQRVKKHNEQAIQLLSRYHLMNEIYLNRYQSEGEEFSLLNFTIDVAAKHRIVWDLRLNDIKLYQDWSSLTSIISESIHILRSINAPLSNVYISTSHDNDQIELSITSHKDCFDGSPITLDQVKKEAINNLYGLSIISMLSSYVNLSLRFVEVKSGIAIRVSFPVNLKSQSI